MLEGDAGQGTGHPPHRHRRVDHTEAGVLVQHHQVIAVEIEQWPRANTALEVQGHPGLAALGCIAPQLWGLRLVEPGTGGDSRKRLPRGAVGDPETNVGKGAFGQGFPDDRARFKINHDPVALQPLLRLARGNQR
ncbi:hypothetical protein D3C76_1394410 [compost metagenome]